MTVWEEFRDFFTGDREVRREAQAIVQEVESRQEERKYREGVSEFVSLGHYEALRSELDLVAHTIAPQPETGLDASGAYWLRKGIEQAINRLDIYIGARVVEDEDGH